MTNEIWNAIKNQSYDLEFDWFGIDKVGQISVFSSFNRGYTPKKAILSQEKYFQLQKLILNLPIITKAITFTNEKGNFSDWISYSEKGLFAFDYQDAHRVNKTDLYDLITKPIKPLLASHIKELNYFIEIIPVFDLIFENNISFEDLKNFEM